MLGWARNIWLPAIMLIVASACATLETRAPERLANDSGSAARDWVIFRAHMTGQGSSLVMHGMAPRTQFDPEADRLCAIQNRDSDSIYVGTLDNPGNLEVLEIYAGELSFQNCIAKLILPSNLNPAVPFEVVVFGRVQDDGSVLVVDWNRPGNPLLFSAEHIDSWRDDFDVDALIEVGIIAVE